MNILMDWLFTAVKFITSLLLVFMVVLITAQVALRLTTGASIKWAEEVSLIVMVWVAFLTLAQGVHSDSHIRINMFVAWLPRPWRIALECFLDTLLLFTTVMMIYYGGVLTKFAMRSAMPATRFPTAVVYMVVPVAGIFCLIQLLVRLLGGKRSVAAQSFIDGVAYEEGGDNA